MLRLVLGAALAAVGLYACVASPGVDSVAPAEDDCVERPRAADALDGGAFGVGDAGAARVARPPDTRIGPGPVCATGR
jgi:hypothetical protein